MLKSSRQSTEIVERFGNWEVLDDGSLYEKVENWHITPDRLTEPDWWFTFRTIPNFDYNTFMPAMHRALEIAKINQLTIVFNYHNDDL